MQSWKRLNVSASVALKDAPTVSGVTRRRTTVQRYIIDVYQMQGTDLSWGGIYTRLRDVLLMSCDRRIHASQNLCLVSTHAIVFTLNENGEKQQQNCLVSCG